MRTFYSVLKEAADILKANNIEECDVDARLLMLEICQMSSTDLLLKKSEEMPDSLYEKYMDAIARRSRHIPLQYITGYAYFMGYEFVVNENVLIPRMDTECLVCEAEKLLGDIESKDGDYNVLDMCTGSGCIILSLALRNKNLTGLGVDISKDALKVAMDNKKKLSVDAVEFVESDLFENVSGEYDMIVSNPPYIRTAVIDGLTAEVKNHEPFGALDGHEDGLYFYRLITEMSTKFIKTGGYLCYEIGYDQGVEVADIMKENGYTSCQIIKDLAGLDRVVTGKKQ